jgi:hypothetical protein
MYVPETRHLFSIPWYEIRGRHALNPSGGTVPERYQNDARRSTRLPRQILVVITSLDPARSFSWKYETVVVNAHGCGVIVSERLEKGTRVTGELISNGQNKQARIVLVISLVEDVSWLLGIEFDSPTRDFWEIENPPTDWAV